MKTGQTMLAALALAAMPVMAFPEESIDGLAAYYLEDYEQALKILRPLAEDGEAEAQDLLGRMYERGHGVTQDGQRALELYRLAADQGYPAAQVNLGWLFALGEGVTQDLIVAHMWWNVASANGAEHARKSRDLLALSMNPDQIAEAQLRARRCIATDYKDCN